MMFGQNRTALRELFFTTWSKAQTDVEPLTALEQQIFDVINQHPEYQHIFSNPDKYKDKDYLPEQGETNPFLHMSLHLGLEEQLATNRPAGIAKIYKKLTHKLKDAHKAQHAMIECLAEALWLAQKNNTLPDEKAYLESLQRLSR